MPITIRKKYFSLLNKKEKALNKNVILTVFSAVLDFSENNLILHFDDELTNEEQIDFLINEILKGKPYQYVLGKTYFLGNEFKVDNSVLIPRQETEQLCMESANIISSFFKSDNVKILDIGTGSGNIAISLAKMVKNAQISAIDISKKAIEIANFNAINNNVKIDFNCADIFSNINLENYDVIISNPPYIKDEFTVEKSTLKYEPHLALFANPQTKFYDRILQLVSQCEKIPYLISFEIEENMRCMLIDSVKRYLPSSLFYFQNDLYNKVRFLYIINPMKTRNIKLAKQTLDNHGVICFPTDTIMGLAIKYDDYQAYMRLNQIKKRPENKPYTLMVKDKEDIKKYAHVNDKAKLLIDKFLPGALTLLLPTKEVPSFVDHGTGIVGIRVAPTDLIKNIIDEVGCPLLVPSANRSGEPPIINSVEVRIKLPEIDFIIDGEAEGKIATTIIDLTKDDIKIIREGPISLLDIKKCLEVK